MKGKGGKLELAAATAVGGIVSVLEEKKMNDGGFHSSKMK